jgi:hypothetical protein
MKMTGCLAIPAKNNAPSFQNQITTKDMASAVVVISKIIKKKASK